MPDEQTEPLDMPGIVPTITLETLKGQLDSIEAKLDQALGRQASTDGHDWRDDRRA